MPCEVVVALQTERKVGTPSGRQVPIPDSFRLPSPRCWKEVPQKKRNDRCRRGTPHDKGKNGVPLVVVAEVLWLLLEDITTTMATTPDDCETVAVKGDHKVGKGEGRETTTTRSKREGGRPEDIGTLPVEVVVKVMENDGIADGSDDPPTHVMTRRRRSVKEKMAFLLALPTVEETKTKDENGEEPTRGRTAKEEERTRRKIRRRRNIDIA